jgi:hypothetical protein
LAMALPRLPATACLRISCAPCSASTVSRMLGKTVR